MYDTGALLRLKYSHLFPDNGYFRLRNMRIMTSVPERTMMSLQSFMAGFFPPPLLDSTLPIWWQPFFTEVDHKGEVIYFDQEQCPRYIQQLYGIMMNPPEDVLRWVEEDREILDYVSQQTGAPLNNFMEVMMFSETLKAQIYIEPVPSWLVEIYYSTLEKYVARSFTLMHHTFEMQRIRGGPLITQIVENLEAVQRGDSSGAPIMIYSAHDMTIFSLAFALGVQDQIPAIVNYADTMMVDLMRNGNVEVYYLNNGKTIPTRTLLNVPGCGRSCPLATFRRAVANMIVTDLNALCN